MAPLFCSRFSFCSYNPGKSYTEQCKLNISLLPAVHNELRFFILSRGGVNVAIIYGYIRVSSHDQNKDRQLIAMAEKHVPASNLFVDKQSGKTLSGPSTRKWSTSLNLELCYTSSASTGWAVTMRRFRGSGVS